MKKYIKYIIAVSLLAATLAKADITNDFVAAETGDSNVRLAAYEKILADYPNADPAIRLSADIQAANVAYSYGNLTSLIMHANRILTNAEYSAIGSAAINDVPAYSRQHLAAFATIFKGAAENSAAGIRSGIALAAAIPNAQLAWEGYNQLSPLENPITVWTEASTNSIFAGDEIGRAHV